MQIFDFFQRKVARGMNSIKYKFKWAGDLIDYLETPVKEIEELVQKLKLTKLVVVRKIQWPD